jgi:hypothetical protein
VSPQILAGIGLPLLLGAIYHAMRRCQSRKDREMQLALAGMHEFAADPSTQPFHTSPAPAVRCGTTTYIPETSRSAHVRTAASGTEPKSQR